MRFVDSNVFIYAVLKPRRALTSGEKKIKQASKAILERINQGEQVITSTVHLSEVANILEDAANQALAIKFIIGLMSRSNIVVATVTREQYLLAAIMAEEKHVSVNDALAYVIMRQEQITEIYTFDQHFRNLPVEMIDE